MSKEGLIDEDEKDEVLKNIKQGGYWCQLHHKKTHKKL
jgi:hypothetical protein